MVFTKPDEFLSRVELIDAKKLVAAGIRTVLIDIDNTLVPRGTNTIPPSIVEWISTLKALGLCMCLISNNWHKAVFTYAETLKLPIVYKAMKPLPFAFLRALKKAGDSRSHACADRRRHTRVAGQPHVRIGRRPYALVVGDQLLTDVFGAHVLGIRAILVLPQARNDLTHTLLLRRIERVFLRDMKPTR